MYRKASLHIYDHRHDLPKTISPMINQFGVIFEPLHECSNYTYWVRLIEHRCHGNLAQAINQLQCSWNCKFGMIGNYAKEFEVENVKTSFVILADSNLLE